MKDRFPTKHYHLAILLGLALLIFIWPLGISSAGMGTMDLGQENPSAIKNDTYSISGKISDAEGKPLPNVLVQACDLSRQPVLLIRGGDGPEVLAEDRDGLAWLYRWMQAEGYVQGCNLFYATGVSSFKTREQNRQAVQENLRKVYDQLVDYYPHWQGHFDIIGHSFGGLIGRFYLESPTYTADQEYADYGIHVDNLITLGTPHGGARVPEEIYPATMFIAGEPLFTPGSPDEFLSVAQLVSSAMDIYNFTHRQPSGVRYHVLAGDFLQQEEVPFLIELVYAPYAAYPGDIAVSLRSAAQLGLNPALQFHYPDVCLLFNDDMHGYADILGLGELRSYVRPETTYQTMIKDALGSQGGDCPPLDDGIDKAGLLEPDIPFDPPLLLAKGTVDPGKTETGSFPVDWSGRAAFYLVWRGEDLDFSLTAPDGRVINPGVAGTDPRIGFGKLQGPDTGLAAYLLLAADAGEWAYQVAAREGHGPRNFALYALPQSALAEFTDRELRAGMAGLNEETHVYTLSDDQGSFLTEDNRSYQGSTDAEGFYRIAALPPGDYRVLPLGEDFTPNPRIVRLPPNAEGVDMKQAVRDRPLFARIFLPMIRTID